MHSANLVHRDMKPSNLLLNSECLMKVADFGLARSLQENEGKAGDGADVLTDYVATRWYRAPEILLGSTKYGKAVDLWSLGCIFGEMVGGKPVFPGTSTLNQLEKICEVIGKPNQQEKADMNSQFAETMLDSLNLSGGSPSGAGWDKMFPGHSSDTLDLLRKLMRFSPHERITAQEGLRHPYCKQFHDAETETRATSMVTVPFDDNKKRTTSDYREKLYQEMSGSKQFSRTAAGRRPR